MVLREVEALLDKGRAVGAKPLKEYMEVQGYGDAAAWVYRQALEPGDWTKNELLTVQTVRHVHHLAINPVWEVAPHPDATDREAPGSLREHDIHPFGGGMMPPDWPLVPGLLDAWVTQVNKAARSAAQGAMDRPLPEVLAELHNAFERVHPFLDGNGRAGRLLLNLVLVRLGNPPVIILKRQRPQYLAALQKADNDDFGPLGEILARAMYDNLNRFILPNLAGPARIVPLAALTNDEFAALRCAKPLSAGASTQSRGLTACGGAAAKLSTNTATPRGNVGGDVNASRRRLSIERNAVEVGTEIHISTPKNHERRSVPYIQMLDGLFEKACADKPPEALLFPGPDGELRRRTRTDGSSGGWFAGAVRRAGIPRVTRHDLLHTAGYLIWRQRESCPTNARPQVRRHDPRCVRRPVRGRSRRGRRGDERSGGSSPRRTVKFTAVCPPSAALQANDAVGSMVAAAKLLAGFKGGRDLGGRLRTVVPHCRR